MFDQNLYDKLTSRIRKDESGCWIWTAYWYKNRPYPGNRYGYFGVKLAGKWKTRTAHRCMWAALHGWPTKDQCVCHTCDVALCINPEHLYLGTMADNMRDRDERGRHANKLKKVCKRGHLLEGANVYIRKSAIGNDARWCRACGTGNHRVKAGWPPELAYTLPVGPIGYVPPEIVAILGKRTRRFGITQEGNAK